MLVLWIYALTVVYAQPCWEPNGKKQVVAEMYPILGYASQLTVHGRIVREKKNFSLLDVTPKHDISVDERKKGMVSFHIGSAQVGSSVIDQEGWVGAHIQDSILPGEYEVEVQWEGCVIGSASMRVLPQEYQGIVVRSDVDMTYLYTDFHSKSSMLALLDQSAAQRQSIAGMPEVYQLLRDKNGHNRPLTFISGSPVFFKRVLQNKMSLEAIQHDEIVLKPFTSILSQKGLGGIPLLKEQIGYKLDALLRLRQQIPPQSQEVLIGDDTEADPLIYALYAQLLRKEYTEEELMLFLKKHDVSEHWKEKIQEQLPLFWASLGEGALVVEIFIHQTKEESTEFEPWKTKERIFFYRTGEELKARLLQSPWMQIEAKQKQEEE